MIPIKIELSIFVLLTTILLVSSRPHQRSKRSIVKDYLNPLTYPTSGVKFEKGEDGKYHPQVIDSKVEYALAKNLENLNTVTEDVLKSTGSLEDGIKKATESSTDTAVELSKTATENPLKDNASEDAKTSSFLNETPKGSEFGLDSKPIIDSQLGEISAKTDGNSKSTFSLVKQEDHKLQFQPKPDGKDDQPYELEPTLEEFLPQPPLAPEKNEGIGKLAIGQIPFLSRIPFFSSVIPVFLPERTFSLGVFSGGIPPAVDVQDRLPSAHDVQGKLSPAVDVQDRLPPAIDIQGRLTPAHDVQGRLPPVYDVQDRLPMSDAEVFEEGSEWSVIENVNPLSGVVRGVRRTEDHRFRYPFGPHFTFPLSTMRKSIKDVMDGQSLQEKSKAQIVDMMGKKMLLQNKVVKYPTDDSSNMYVGVMSVQPLEEVDIETLKKLGLEKDVKEVDKTDRETEDKRREEDGQKENPIPRINVDQVPINLSEEENLSIANEKQSRKDVFEVQESKLDTKNEISRNVVAQATGISLRKNPEADVKEVTESKLDKNSDVKDDVVAQATGITLVSKEVSHHPEEDVLKVEESKLNKKKEKSDTVLTESHEIPSISKEMVIKKVTDGEVKNSDEETKVLSVHDSIEEIILKLTEGNMKEKTDLVSGKHGGSEEKDEERKELTKNVGITSYETKNKQASSEIENDLKNEATKKVIEDSKDDEELKSEEHATNAQDSKEKDENEPQKEKDLLEGKASSDARSAHESSSEESDEEEDFKEYERALKKKDLNVKDIDLKKIDGVLFAESRKKKLAGENRKDVSKQKSKKSRKECKCEGSTDGDSDSEDD